ncbi:ABC transporter ATP-binding protein [Cellulomonas phragmiteti]|uniref:ABC transporter ATP-binding protein n=1 Tax=Cellulomonas phragmiteti TaxID=478780 RepID=A0ABQ4DMK4_9CELL|nr:ABC transporter ATP-binding protein [Cellulomonas phragmiteti]GIG40590.1 ABC transporter ATP-binding protein [Cellulomonas phragmiteti]
MTTTGPRTPGPLARLIAPVRRRVVAATVLQGLAAGTGIAPLVLLVELARGLLAPAPLDADRLWLLVGGALLAALVSLLLGAASTVVSHRADDDLQLAVRRDLAAHLSRVPLGWYSRHGSGRAKRALHDDVGEVHQLVAHTVPELAGVVAVPLVTLVYLVTVDWQLALVALVLVVAGVALFARAMAGGMAKMGEYARAMGDVSSATVEFVRGIRVVKQLGSQDQASSRFVAAADAFADFFVAWSRSTTAVTVGSFLLLSAPTVTVVVVTAGVLLAAAGRTDPVDVVAFALLAPALCAPMNAIGARAQQITGARGAAARIADVLAVPELVTTGTATPEGARVELRGVRFAYEPAPGDEAHEVLHGIDLTLEPGTVTALVGPSGAGKTTLATLPARFADPTGGAVLVGGADLRDVPADVLYRTVGFVFQDVQLLRASITENIALARPDATPEQVRAAARAARIDDRVEAMPRGYDSVVGEDVQLSGGEAQRVAIARTLLADPPVLVLDEATAAVDPSAEAHIQDAVSELARGRTVLVVAHRLPTVVGADRIVVLDDGCVVEDGTHSDLLAREGAYARLWAAWHDQAAPAEEAVR